MGHVHVQGPLLSLCVSPVLASMPDSAFNFQHQAHKMKGRRKRFTSTSQNRGSVHHSMPAILMQGMEKDIILLATTITHAGAFATDAHRVNVALTRARHHLVILGCSQVLQSSSAAFRMLLSRCQMLPAGAHLLVPRNKTSMCSVSDQSPARVHHEHACASSEQDQAEALSTVTDHSPVHVHSGHTCASSKQGQEEAQFDCPGDCSKDNEPLDLSSQPQVGCLKPAASQGAQNGTVSCTASAMCLAGSSPQATGNRGFLCGSRMQVTSSAVGCTAEGTPAVSCLQQSEQGDIADRSKSKGHVLPNLVFDIDDV